MCNTKKGGNVLTGEFVDENDGGQAAAANVSRISNAAATSAGSHLHITTPACPCGDASIWMECRWWLCRAVPSSGRRGDDSMQLPILEY